MTHGPTRSLGIAIAFLASLAASPASTDEAGSSNAPIAEAASAPTGGRPGGVSRPTVETFRLIHERNIFDPNRASRASRSRRNSETPRTVRTESFTLVGTLIHEKGSFAFFDSSTSDYRKTVPIGEKLAGYQIAEIASSGIKMVAAGGTNDLPVGAQMRREDEGEWKMSLPAASRRPLSVASGSSTVKAEDASFAEEAELLKRLMQKREQELNK